MRSYQPEPDGHAVCQPPTTLRDLRISFVPVCKRRDPVRTPGVLCFICVTASTHYARMSWAWSCERVLCIVSQLLILSRVILIQRPLAQISKHIIESPSIRLQLSNPVEFTTTRSEEHTSELQSQ